MKLVLRKEDSSTSVLLFLYNMAHTRSGKTVIRLNSLLEILAVFGKAESATRMSLSRACKAGVLESARQGKDVEYALTAQAMEHIRSWNDGTAACWKRFGMRQQPWDGMWHSVTVDLDNGAAKSTFVERMEELGYAQVDGLTFLSPRARREDVDAVFLRMGGEGKLYSVHGTLHTGDQLKGLLETAFGLGRLRPLYQAFLGKYEGMLAQVEADPSDDPFPGGKALPLLHQLGFDFFRAAADDPFLPKALLPDWEGERAALLMRQLRAALEESCWRYLINLL